MAHRVLRDELQEGWIVEIVPSFESDVLVHEFWMLFQKCAKAFYIAGVDKINGAAEGGVFDALVVGQIHAVGERRGFDVALQARPTGISGFAGDGELPVGEFEAGGEDLVVGGVAETRVKFSDALAGGWIMSGKFVEQIFSLMLKVVEVGMVGEAADWHGELPFVGPRSALRGRK